MPTPRTPAAVNAAAQSSVNLTIAIATVCDREPIDVAALALMHNLAGLLVHRPQAFQAGHAELLAALDVAAPGIVELNRQITPTPDTPGSTGSHG